jgi:hypothetical protein
LLFPSAAAAAVRVHFATPPAPVIVSHDRFAAHSEPMLAINPLHPADLIGGSKFFTDPAHYRFKIGTYVSLDGGTKWTDNGVLPGFARYRTTSDISFAFAPDGRTVYACLLAVAGKASGIFVSRSLDGGRHWLSPSTVYLDRSGTTFNDKPWIAVDTSHGPYRGRIYVAWNLDPPVSFGDPDAGGDAQAVPPPGERRKTRTGIAVARSSDGGGSFSKPIILSRFMGNEFALGAMPQVGPGGRLHVVFIRFHGPDKRRTYDLAMTGSADGGRTFSAPHVIVPRVDALPNHLPHGTFRNFTLPAFVDSPRTGTLLVAWSDMRHGNADILKSASRDGGRTWSLPSRINDDSVNTGADQFQPQLAVTPGGTFVCTWFDRRFDPGDRVIDTMISASANDGRTFGRNLRVTPHSWNPAIDAPHPNPKGHTTFIGDYQGLAAGDAVAYPFWNDTSNGRTQEIRVRSVPLASMMQP